jgi:hypothetical protein
LVSLQRNEWSPSTETAGQLQPKQLVNIAGLRNLVNLKIPTEMILSPRARVLQDAVMGP